MPQNPSPAATNRGIQINLHQETSTRRCLEELGLRGCSQDKERWPGGVERDWGLVFAHRTKRGGQEVLRGTGALWSHTEQREVARRC